jgi:transaldolase
MKVKYVSNDNREFPDAESCRAYELMIEAGADSEFRTLVRNLFKGQTSYVSGQYLDDDSEEMFNIARNMDGFIANLVIAIPALQAELSRAFEKVKNK